LAIYFPTRNGRIKIQAETLLGTDPGNGWVYQAAGTGNNSGAQGSGYYYFKSETDTGSVKFANQGVFGATVYVEEAGLYTLRVRSARDSNDPGDARNDIWVRVDDDIRSALPEGTGPLDISNGYVKLKGANTAWGYTRLFSAASDADSAAAPKVYLSEGFHTISFAGRSVGFHIDFVELVRDGLLVAATAADTPMLETPGLPDTATVAEDSSLLLDPVAGTGGATLTGASDPANGSTALTPEGRLRYTPDADFFGTDSFSYTVRDANGLVSTQRMTVTVTPVADAPFAAADAAATAAGTAVVIPVLANDGDADGTAVAVRSFDATSAAGGSVTLVGGQLRYSPALGFTGNDSFTYDVIDPTGRGSARATVTVAVTEAPSEPILVRFYDTATDAVAARLSDGLALDAAALDGPATLAVDIVEGGALDGRVGSVRLRLSGDATATRTESGAPYSLFGDKAGDYLGGIDFDPGSYRLVVDVYSAAGGRGTLLDSFDYDFTVRETVVEPEPIRVRFFDTATDTVAARLADGLALDAAVLDGPATLAVDIVEGGALDGQVGSVRLRLSGDATATRTESGAPYSLFGDKAGDYLGGLDFDPGSYRLVVDVYSAAGGRGTLLDSFDYDFTVTGGLLLV
jgi:hypothetical protein